MRQPSIVGATDGDEDGREVVGLCDGIDVGLTLVGEIVWGVGAVVGP